MITAEQLQGYLLLFRQGPASNEHLWAGKVVEVVAYDHLNSFRIAHGCIDLLEEGNLFLTAWNARAGLQVHTMHALTFDNVSSVIITADECGINGTLDAQLLLHRLGVTLQVSVGLTDFINKYLVILDHIKVILISENSVHLTVQLLEGALDGVSPQCVIALIFTEEMVASEGIHVPSIVRCDGIQVNTAAALSVQVVAVVTELGASHEVVACLFGVFLMHLAGLWVKLVEHVSTEAVKVLHKAESRCTIWHGLEIFLFYGLGFDVVEVDVIFLEEDDRVFITPWLGTLHGSVQMFRDPREDFGDVLGVAVLQLVLIIAEHLVVQEEENVVVFGGAVLVVHAEGSVYMAQVVMVIQLREGLIGQLCFAMEALEQMVTLEKVWDSFFVHCNSIHLKALTTV